jgi:hypothetical protein
MGDDDLRPPRVDVGATCEAVSCCVHCIGCHVVCAVNVVTRVTVTRDVALELPVLTQRLQELWVGAARLDARVGGMVVKWAGSKVSVKESERTELCARM